MYGRAYCFGKTDDPQAALDRWLAMKDDLLAGRTPRAPIDGLTVRDLVNSYLTSKKMLLDTGEIVARTFRRHHETCERVVRYFGRSRVVSDIGPQDFEGFRAELAKSLSPLTLRVTITHIRSIFRYAQDQGLVENPVCFGQGFRLPSKPIPLT